MLYAKDLCLASTNINPNLVTIPDEFIPNKLNETGLALWHKVTQGDQFKDVLDSVFIIISNKCNVINKYAYGIRKSDGSSIKTGPIIFSNLIENGWLYTLNGSFYKIATFST